MKRPRLSLATQILAFQLAIILAAVALGAAASVWWAQGQLDKRYEARALSIAQSVASMPSVRDALHDSDPSRTLQPLAEGLRQASGASFVVITDSKGIRMSHPNPALIGKPIDEAAKGPLSGQTFVGIEKGTLGRSVRGKTPIIDGNGKIIGIVSVGFLVETVASQAADVGPQVGIFLVIALALSSGGSLLLTRRLKRQTFGLEPREMVGLLEQREASLHGIREGTIATDRQGRITLLNDEARRLLRLPEDAEGRRLENLLPAGRVHDILTGEASGSDQVVIARDRVLVVNRMPVIVRGETIGWVVTLRDRTELESMVRQLGDARSLTDALRAQAHEFSNRLHTIAGLVEMGRYDEAIRSSTESSAVSQELTESLIERVGNPPLAGLLLAKAALAAERRIEFLLSSDTHLEEGAVDSHDLVTVVGNLVDNAFDAVNAPGTHERRVEVSVVGGANAVELKVQDWGPGVPADLDSQIFTEGFSTKKADGPRGRGLGLALVMQVVLRHGGDIRVHNDGGAVFEVRLPVRRAAAVTP